MLHRVKVMIAKLLLNYRMLLDSKGFDPFLQKFLV